MEPPGWPTLEEEEEEEEEKLEKVWRILRKLNLTTMGSSEQWRLPTSSCTLHLILLLLRLLSPPLLSLSPGFIH